ncbi:MAG: response regulator transcription factor [Verrucomicrobiota bacterium]
MTKIRVLIADDQTLITESFKVLLESKAADITVVGICKDGKEAVALMETTKPDIVLMDVHMPEMDGVRATELIRRNHPEAKIILLTTFDDESYIIEALRLGAIGYLLKDVHTEELISSIRAAHDGTVLLSAAVVKKLWQRKVEVAATPADRERLEVLHELTQREIDILRLLAQGEENKEIGLKLNAAEQTIKNSVSAIYTKLGVSSRREARRFALEIGLVSPIEFVNRNL